MKPDSLTAQLSRLCPHALRVELLRQAYRRPTLKQRQALGHGPRYALCRAVRLWCGSTPWVYAESVIPRQCLTGRWRRLAHLRTQPLGRVLYRHRARVREYTSWFEAVPDGALHGRATCGLKPAYGVLRARQRLLQAGRGWLLVTEVFLTGRRTR